MLLDDWASLMAPYGFSPRFARWSFLAVASALLENRCYMLDNGGGYVYPTIYVLLIGPPATFKTTTSDRAVTDALGPLVTEAEGPYMGPSIATPAAMVKIFRENNTKNLLNAYNSSPMFVYAPEWTTFYRDIGGGEMTTDLLNFYDPKPPGAKWTKVTVKDGTQEVISPALTILGCTTMRNLVDSRMLGAGGTGIVSRFIFVYEPKRPRGSKKRVRLAGRPELSLIQAHLRALRGMRGEFRLTDNAEACLEHLTDRELAWHQANPADTLFSHYKARRGTQMRKLAMLVSALTRTSMVIEPEDLLTADRLLAEIEPDMPQAFGAQIQYKDPGLHFKLLERIPLQGITESGLMHVFQLDGQALPKDNELRAVVDGLVAAKLIEVFKDPTNGEITYRRLAAGVVK